MRRTKEDALQTREKLLETAERLFAEQGVGRTSLQDIAAAAGMTRGAIYWHFKDKADLFCAMMDRAVLPMEETLKDLTDQPDMESLEHVRDALLNALRLIAEDERTRRVFGIATRKTEFGEELASVHERRLATQLRCRAYIEGAVRRAQKRGVVKPLPNARMVAVNLQAIITGLIELWMLDPTMFPLVKAGQQALDTYLAGLKPS